MDIGVFRDVLVKRLQATADAQTSMAMNAQPRAASNGIPAMSADEYAMTQINYLATARANLFAIRIVEEEYKKLTTPEKTETGEPQEKTKRVAYG